MDRHFCVTTYVTNSDHSKFLMILHKKLKKWMPPGGHIDPNEIPDNAAVRETREETGLDVKLIGERINIKDTLVRPFGVQLNTVEENHEHIDLIYLAIPKTSSKLILNRQESDGIQWYGKDTVLGPEFNTFDTVKNWVMYFSGLSQGKGYPSGIIQHKNKNTLPHLR